MSAAELDALDRGLVEVGVLAAEDRARIEVLEARVGAIFSMMRELARGAGLPVPENPAKPRVQQIQAQLTALTHQ